MARDRRDVIGSRAEFRNRPGSVLDEGDFPEERHEEVMDALDIDKQPIDRSRVSNIINGNL